MTYGKRLELYKGKDRYLVNICDVSKLTGSPSREMCVPCYIDLIESVWNVMQNRVIDSVKKVLIDTNGCSLHMTIMKRENSGDLYCTEDR